MPGRWRRMPASGGRRRSPPMAEPTLDLICIGRAAVDFYGEQIGSRLEDMTSFAKYLGGCAANIAFGTAPLALRSAMLSRVGDEHMGRFVRGGLGGRGGGGTPPRTHPPPPTPPGVPRGARPHP